MVDLYGERRGEVTSSELVMWWLGGSLTRGNESRIGELPPESYRDEDLHLEKIMFPGDVFVIMDSTCPPAVNMK